MNALFDRRQIARNALKGAHIKNIEIHFYIFHLFRPILDFPISISLDEKAKTENDK